MQSIDSFKNILKELATEISQDSNKPFVVILDELDRCKPTYAVALVEKINHLFSVENTVFVLVLHKMQLEEAIRSVYGQNIDARIYLQKFITIECILPKNIGMDNANDYTSYCQRLYRFHELQEFDAQGDIALSLSALSNHLSLSLRQIEKVFTVISIFLVAWGKNGRPNLAIVSFLSTTKVINQVLYNSIKINKSKWDDIDAFFSFPKEEKVDRNSRALSRISDWIKCCIYTDAEYNALDKEDEIIRLGRYFNMYERDQIIPAYCRYMDFAKIAG